VSRAKAAQGKTHKRGLMVRIGKWLSAALVIGATSLAAAQVKNDSQCPHLAIGADVSFLPQAEADGTVFHANGVAKPALEILCDHGYGWVRLRIFNNPTTLPNNLAYTIAEAKKAKALHLGLVLDFHYSDDWADPSHQVTPVAWQKLKHPQLTEAVFTCTRDTIAAFSAASAMPDIVQIGNEVTSGMLWPDGKLPDNWPNFIDLLKAGIRGVAAGGGTATPPRIMIHIDQGGNSQTTAWFFSHLVDANVNFDVIGQSYYPWWQGSLSDLKANLDFMARQYHKPIVIVETAYSWRADNYTKKPGPFPEAPEGQRAFLQALAAIVAATPGGLGRGIFWWEPAVRGPLARRGLFDDNGNSLPALDAFDACMR
jgi:arabinogalactan endo-1,4-beta-galactosidase